MSFLTREARSLECHPPAAGYIKINIDAAFHDSKTLAAIAGCNQNSNGLCHGGFGKVLYTKTPQEAEVWGIF